MSHSGYRTASRSSHRSGEALSTSKSATGRPGKNMAQVLDTMDRSKSRKDRNFIGGECAVCEEPLELTLRGERILQLSCAHIAHEACFYEYLREFDSHLCPTCNAPLGLDSSRGATVPSIGKSLVLASTSAHSLRRDRHLEFSSKISISEAEGICTKCHHISGSLGAVNHYRDGANPTKRAAVANSNVSRSSGEPK